MTTNKPMPPNTLPICYYSPQYSSRNLADWLKQYKDWIGVGTWNWTGPDCASWDEVLQVIDSCLYCIRASGRNTENITKTIQYLECLGGECMRRKKYYEH